MTLQKDVQRLIKIKNTTGHHYLLKGVVVVTQPAHGGIGQHRCRQWLDCLVNDRQTTEKSPAAVRHSWWGN